MNDYRPSNRLYNAFLEIRKNSVSDEEIWLINDTRTSIDTTRFLEEYNTDIEKIVWVPYNRYGTNGFKYIENKILYSYIFETLIIKSKTISMLLDEINRSHIINETLDLFMWEVLKEKDHDIIYINLIDDIDTINESLYSSLMNNILFYTKTICIRKYRVDPIICILFIISILTYVVDTQYNSVYILFGILSGFFINYL